MSPSQKLTPRSSLCAAQAVAHAGSGDGRQKTQVLAEMGGRALDCEETQDAQDTGRALEMGLAQRASEKGTIRSLKWNAA